MTIDAAPLPVGLIGAGRIALTGHLPAYAAGNVPLAAVCSRSGTTAQTLADSWPGTRPKVHQTATDVAADPDVALLDVVTRPHDRLDLIRRLLPYGKPILVQKPLAYTLEEAAAITREAAEANVPIAVNHNARWWPPQRILTEWVRQGELGQLAHIAHVHHFSEDIRTWYTDRDDYLFIEHGLHFLDLVRKHAGREPTAVAARAVKLPGQAALCPLAYTVMLRFGGDPLVAALTLYNATRSPAAWACHWSLNGTHGDASATYTSATLHTRDGHTITHTPTGDWVPDGLLAAYREFVTALSTGTPSQLDPADHLKTLALATAAARSARADGQWTNVPHDETPPEAVRHAQR